MKRVIKASNITKRMMYFDCPVCYNRTVIDIDNDVYSLLDIDYKDRFICDECGSEFTGEVTHDNKVKFTPLTEEDW